MADTDYVYQADDAELVGWEANLTSRNGDGLGDSEENLRGAILMAAAGKAAGRFLDIGSGHGRIIEWLKPYAKTIIGVEPDKSRFLSCANTFEKDNNVTIINGTTSDLSRLNRKPFDLITASMVLQHVSTDTCRSILNDVRLMLHRTGVALIATTHFPFERFTYQSDPSSKKAADFDLYAARSGSHDYGLPVRMFSKASFENVLESSGLSTVFWQQFSYIRPEKLEGMASLYSMKPEDMRNCGISQFSLVRRKNEDRRHWW